MLKIQQFMRENKTAIASYIKIITKSTEYDKKKLSTILYLA